MIALDGEDDVALLSIRLRGSGTSSCGAWGQRATARQE
jgi:hypothetical protein